MAARIRLFDRLRIGAQEFLIPYGTVWLAASGEIPDKWAEISPETADARNLDNVVRTAVGYAQQYGAAARAAGQPEFEPIAQHETTTVNDRIAHFIRILLDFGAREWKMPLAVYDPSRDSAAEAEDLKNTADACAAMISNAMVYYAKSDVVFNMSGGVSSSTEG